MWKLWHRLFGWDYVLIENNAAGYVRRIWWRGDGVPMITAYSGQIWPLMPPYHGWTVTPLTRGAVELVAFWADVAAARPPAAMPPASVILPDGASVTPRALPPDGRWIL